MKEKLKELKVLYVEDDESIAVIDEQIYRMFFKSVDLALDGAKGLELYNSGDYDLIISDETMPVMNGSEMVAKIREEDQDIKIIMITAHSDAAIFNKFASLNISGYITKPFDYEEIIEMLEMVFDE